MKGLENDAYLALYITANLLGIFILLLAIMRPKTGRFILFLLFAWACTFNIFTSYNNPEVYLNYSTLSVQLYGRFINGWFKDHITLMVTAIAICQGLIAIGMLLRGWWVKLASFGAIAFLLSIAPLGVGSGFPFSITVSLAVCIILKRDNLESIWHSIKTNVIHEHYG